MENFKEIMDSIKVEDGLFTEDDMMNDKSAVSMDMKKDEIVDLEKLTGDLMEFLEYISKPEMKEMETQDHTAYVRHLENKFEKFSLDQINTFKMITSYDEKKSQEENHTIRDQNITRLLGMIEILVDVKAGKRDMNTEFSNLRENLNEEYIYPQFGGKTNFEKEMTKRNKKKNKNK